MTCSRDQTYEDVLYGASDAAPELGGSRIQSCVCGDEKSLTNLILIMLRNKCTFGFKLLYTEDYDLPRTLSQCDLSNPLI